MSGTTMPVIGMTSYDFQQLGVSNKEAEVPVAQNLDVSAYTSGALLVRVHAINVASSASIEVNVYPVLPSSQDPTKAFRATTSIATVVLNSNAQGGLLEIDEFSAPMGSFVTVTVKGKTATSPPNNLEATISVELSLKS